MIKYKVENGVVVFGAEGKAVPPEAKYYSVSSDLCVTFWLLGYNIPPGVNYIPIPTLREVCIDWLRNCGTNRFAPSKVDLPAMPFGMVKDLPSGEIALPDGGTITLEDVYGHTPRAAMFLPYGQQGVGNINATLYGDDRDVPTVEPTVKYVDPTKATSILSTAAETIGNRASERDTESERSMRKTVTAFNAMFGHNLTETQGWQFMELLKMARSTGGKFRLDDYLDGAAYAALAGECAGKESVK